MKLKKTGALILAGLLCVLMIAGCTAPAASSADGTSRPAQKEEQEKQKTTEELIAEKVDQMSLHEKVCQMIIVSPESLTGVDQVIAAGETTRKALEEFPAGGILYSKANMKSKAQVKTMLQNTQSYSEIPMILTCDEEGGRVSRLMDTVGTTQVGPMYEYKDQGTEKAYENARTIASDMSALGFNVDMAPVADVWSNPDNTVIGDRAYSDDFDQTAELVGAAVRGFHDGGVGTALKHFPGHGNTQADSHKGAVYVSTSLADLKEHELVPFESGIKSGSDMVMIGHLILTDIDDVPATFSRKIVTDLLRNELGFQGVILTDSLQMGAVTDDYSNSEIALKSVEAGIDMLLCPEDPKEAASALENAVKQGQISEQRIDESITRILTMKENLGILKL